MADGNQSFASYVSAPMVLLKPIYRCDTLADQLLAQIGISYNKPSYQERARTVAGSFLYAVREASTAKADTLIGWPHNDHHWTDYPSVGKKIVQDVREAVTKAKLIDLQPGSGTTIFDDDGNVPLKVTSLYSCSPNLTRNYDLQATSFSDPHRIPVQVAKDETYPERLNRKKKKQSSPKLPIRECEELFRGKWTAARKRMEQINTFYADHPLVLHDGFHCSSVTRVFSEGKLSAGGRLYGAYSNHEQQERVSSKIDGHRVCEIDIRASQPTLLSSLFGYKIGTSWDDIYSDFPFVKKNNDESKRKEARDQVKAVVAELVGVGNADKTNPSKELKEDGMDDFLFLEIKDEAKVVIPALIEMKKSGITSNNYLTFHESEIVLKTIETLIAKNIPAYSVHDSIIVRETDQQQALDTLKETWSDHCIGQGNPTHASTIHPAISVTYSTMKEKLFSGSWE